MITTPLVTVSAWPQDPGTNNLQDSLSNLRYPLLQRSHHISPVSVPYAASSLHKILCTHSSLSTFLQSRPVGLELPWTALSDTLRNCLPAELRCPRVSVTNLLSESSFLSKFKTHLSQVLPPNLRQCVCHYFIKIQPILFGKSMATLRLTSLHRLIIKLSHQQRPGRHLLSL